MRLNQVTITLPDLDAGWVFYSGLGLVPIVDARPDYVRFACPDGGAHFRCIVAMRQQRERPSTSNATI
jgi:hypothetical protein